ncbi:MAG: LptF/LptG family permease [Campylobacterales bacterium]|nr:LptF/LptG family permease [Campylobacterales bacterium]
MHRLRRYILSTFSLLFFSIFLPLFCIASVIFLIKLASYTAVIQLSLWEMFKLYLFILPEILFYTLPITFFVAAALSLFRLSTDNEMVVVFALGIRPTFILTTLMKPAALLSLLLIFDFFVLFPHTTVLSTNFVRYKQSEANFNLQASEFGHNFGDWLLYIGKAHKDRSYGDVVLFHKEQKEEILIQAEKAEVLNNRGILRLKLTKGQGYSYTDEKLTQMQFEAMMINNVMETELRPYRTPIEFWLDPDRRKNKIKMFITDILLSLFPIASLFAALALGIAHVRHQKGYVYLWLFVSMLFYYAGTTGLQKALGFYTIPTVFFSWLFVTYLIYRRRIRARF